MSLMRTVWQDLKHGVRALVKKPGFAAMAVLSLALGIGANAAIFCLLDAVLLKNLPVRQPEQLFFLDPDGAPQFKRSSKVSLAAFDEMRQQHDVLSGLCFFSYATRTNAQVNGQSEMAEAQLVSDGFFSVLGVNPVAGRTFVAGDDKVTEQQGVVVISYNYWQRRFAHSSSVIGQTLNLNRTPFTIIGVTPPDFYGTIVGIAPDVFLPSSAGEQILPNRFHFRDDWLPFVLMRLQPGVSEQYAGAKLSMIAQQAALAEAGAKLTTEKEQSIRKQTWQLLSAKQGLNTLRRQFSAPLRLLMVLVGLVLLIACANVANLLLARAAGRRRELAIRLALGASRLRLIQSLLIEGLLLAILGAVCGLLLASWSSGLILAVLSSGRNPITAGASLSLMAPLDWRVVFFTAMVSLLSALLFGLAPAWRATNPNLTDDLKDRATSVGGAGRFAWGKLLVTVQVALSVFLLVGAGLFIRSLIKLKNVDVGFTRDHVLLFSVDPQSINLQGPQIAASYKQMLERIGTLPDVRSVSLARQGLLSGGGTQGSIKVPGHSLPAGEDRYTNVGNDLEWNAPFFSQVGPQFFETLGMTILRGRGIRAQDNETAPRVAVVNEAFARYYFGAEDPIGQHFDRGGDNGLTEIVGVVRDAKADSIREPAPRAFYVPFLQDPSSWRETTFQVRTLNDPRNLVSSIRREVQAVNPNLALFRVRTLEAQVDESLGQERLVTTLASFFGVLALILAGAGLFGILSYTVNQRTHEIGIRMALGANRSRVVKMILKQGLSLTLVGMAIGLAGAYIATRYVESLETMLYGVTPRDPLTYVITGGGLILVALLACLLPARHATKVDPLVALRYE
jgi:predicted permease